MEYIYRPIEEKMYFLKEEDQLCAIVNPLCSWFERGHRELEWRLNPTPYRVWVSEIMLQQTRVEAVKPYFRRFMESLPGISELAQVSEGQLLKLWEGLGYYSRARNLKKAAVVCMEQYNGELPSSYEKLLKLPGIGTYTAGAIASIAFGIPVPAVDGNVLRVTSRILLSREDIGSSQVKKNMEQCLKKIIEKEKPVPGVFNQGLMELGATVCLPNGTPKCEVCPIQNFCLAHKNHMIDSIPFKAPKKERRMEEKTVFLLWADGKLLLHKRPEKGLLAGLYELPNKEGHLTPEEARQFWEAQTGGSVQGIQELKKEKHIFTHIQWNMTGYEMFLSHLSESMKLGEAWLWVTPDQLKKQYSLPSAFKGYRDFIFQTNVK